MTDSDIRVATKSHPWQSLSPLTALAQRYGFTPYSLFTVLKLRTTPEEFLLMASSLVNLAVFVKNDQALAILVMITIN